MLIDVHMFCSFVENILETYFIPQNIVFVVLEVEYPWNVFYTPEHCSLFETLHLLTHVL